MLVKDLVRDAYPSWLLDYSSALGTTDPLLSIATEPFHEHGSKKQFSESNGWSFTIYLDVFVNLNSMCTMFKHWEYMVAQMLRLENINVTFRKCRNIREEFTSNKTRQRYFCFLLFLLYPSPNLSNSPHTQFFCIFLLVQICKHFPSCLPLVCKHFLVPRVSSFKLGFRSSFFK